MKRERHAGTIFICPLSTLSPPSSLQITIVPGVDEYARGYRGNHGVIDTVNFLWISLTASQRGVEYPHSEEKIHIFEPLKVIRNGRLGCSVTQAISGNP